MGKKEAVSRNGHIALDLTALMPERVTIKAGDRTFQVIADLDPVLASRILRWWQKYSAQALTEEDQPELWAITGLLLAIEPADAKNTLGTVGATAVLDFFMGSLTARLQLMIPSSSPSASAEPMPAASSSETS